MNYFVVVYIGWSIICLILDQTGLKRTYESQIAIGDILVWFSIFIYSVIRAYRERTFEMYAACVASLIGTILYIYMALKFFNI